MANFSEFERLVAASEAIDGNTHLVVLLGGEAGLRCGEIMALEWGDVDLKREPAHLVVRRSEWKGHVTAPKSERIRDSSGQDEKRQSIGRDYRGV
ncbi:MAG: hypothetical protein OEQ13_12340 [Acidobacteriota bacterium]|nr:hypothetical protein [Acidobacteriota bacterium]